MKLNWNEMSPAQKKETIVLTILALVGMIFVILDLSGKWPNGIYYLFLSVMSLFEGVTGWNKNRKLAITELVLAVIFALNFFI